MSRQQAISELLSEHFNPEFLSVENESYLHQVPPNAETHFKVIAVSSMFDSLNRVARHRLVNNILAKEFDTGLHALSLHLYTSTEWQKKEANVSNSPLCQRVNKKIP